MRHLRNLSRRRKSNFKSIIGIAAGLSLLSTINANAVIIDLTYTGSMQAFVVGAGISNIHIEAWGAQGYDAPNDSGGLGGWTAGDIGVTAGDVLNIFVGGRGTEANIADTLMGGGWNGGGHGVSWHSDPGRAGGGGGASDIRFGGVTLLDRILVAGGGGGSTANTPAPGGDGGGLVGESATAWVGYFGGTGGTQAAGGTVNGAFGLGGDAIVGDTGWVGGGGGGWYGGGASPAHFGGGGGSSYIGGVAGGMMTQGVRAGDGLVRLTYDVTGVPEPTTLTLTGLALAGLGFQRRKKA